MKIVFLTTNMARGGAETQVAHLAIRLRRRGHEVDVVSLVQPTAFQAELKEEGVGLHAPGLLGVVFTLARLRPQILHCHMFHANVLGRLLRLVMPFGAVISTLHSVAESKSGGKRLTASFGHGSASRGLVWRDRIYRWTDGLADRTVAVSQAAAERHLQAGAAKAIEVIPNGVDTDLFRPNAEVRRRVRGSLGLRSEFVFIAVGRLMWKKNYPALLRAFRTLGGSTLLIAGAGPQEEELRAMAGSNVVFLGAREDVPELLNAADAYVLTSIVEGLPLALLEAGAAGLPCLATDAGGVGETGIATLVTEETLVSEMNELMELSEPERRMRGEAARARVLEHYSLDTVVTQWEAFYRSLDPWT